MHPSSTAATRASAGALCERSRSNSAREVSDDTTTDRTSKHDPRNRLRGPFVEIRAAYQNPDDQAEPQANPELMGFESPKDRLAVTLLFVAGIHVCALTQK
jgi:hypothetical protein